MQAIKVMVFGTFDGVHLGHLDFFKQAKNLSPNAFLIVSIARDKNVLKIKGKLPLYTERKRMYLVKKNDLVNKVILGGVDNYLAHILKENPDIICLGYDQEAYVKDLKKDLKKNDVLVKIVRLKPYKKHIYKNHLLRKKRVL